MTREENAISAMFFGTLSVACGLTAMLAGIPFFAGLAIGFGIGAVIDGITAFMK